MRAKYLVAALLIALGFNLGIGLAALAPKAYLPVVANGQAKVTETTLINTDTTMVTAYVLPSTTRIIVTYIDRANGNVLHVAEDKGTRLVELSLPPAFTGNAPSVDPQFVYPGPKQANGATVATNGVLHVYACTRDVNDPTGPFKLKRLDVPLGGF